MEVVKVTYNVLVTDQDIDDIVCTAFEGGINYWCKEQEVVGDYLGEYASDQISRGGELKIFCYESVFEEDDTEFTLTKEKLLKGIEMYLANPLKPYEITYVNAKLHKEPVIELDTCQVDATVADMIIQYALFKEIVFG